MASPATLLLLIGCFCHARRSVHSACNATWASAQLDALLADYDREAMPPPPPSPALQSRGLTPPLSVELDIDARHAALRQADSTVRLLADLGLKWKDSRLTWNATEWGCDSTLAAAERLWLPDVFLMNAAEAERGEPMRARLSSNGEVSWVSRLDLSAPVALQLRDWPSDSQSCVFKFASRAHTTDELVLTLKDSSYATVFESSSWEIVSLSGSLSTWGAERGAGARAVGAFRVLLRRRAPAYTLAAAAAPAAVALLWAAAAALPPHARSPLCACAAFASCLWMVSTLSRLPSGVGAPRCVSLAAAQCALAALTALAAALVARLARAASPPPRLVRATVEAASAFCKLTPPEGTAAEGNNGGGVGAWAAAAALLDIVLLIALGFVHLVLLAVYL